MSLQTPSMQVHPFRNHEDDDIEDVGIVHLYRSDSSVYSEPPESWVCSKCSYLNVDGRNLFCAMCGTKNENRTVEEVNRLPQQGQILFSAGSADSMDSISEYELVDHDVRLLSTNPANEDMQGFERSLSVPALNISGQRPGMEDDDDDGEAQPLKPSTGRTAYLSHQNKVDRAAFFSGFSAPPADDSSVMNGSVSSVVTIASISSAMAGSVASASTAMGGSVASSTETPRISNRGHLMPAKVSNNVHIQSDNSVASSAVTEKVSNVLPMSARLQTTKEETTPSSSINLDIPHYANREVLRSVPSNATVTVPRTIKSGIYSIDEEVVLPPSMRALSMPLRPKESDAHSTMSEPQKPLRTKESGFYPRQPIHLEHLEESKPISVIRKQSESSQYTESTADRTSVLSFFQDEPSPTSPSSPSKTIPRATVLPLHHSEGRDRYEGERGGDNEKEKRLAAYLFTACSVVVLMSIVLMVLLIPPNPQTADFNLHAFMFTNPPSPPEAVVGDSTPYIVNPRIPTLSPTQSPQITGFPTIKVPSEEDHAFLLGKLEGEDSTRIGHSVSLGGLYGDAIAFVGAGAFGLARFDAATGNWSAIETINSLERDISETAMISLATEMDRLALGYSGKLEIHEYSASNLKWIRRLVLNDGLIGSTTSHTILSMSGDGMFVAFLQPELGLQMIDVRTWTKYPVSTTPNVAILQVQLSLNGNMLAVLTENGVELKVPDPSNIWVDLVEPISDIKRAAAIALSGNGETLAVTNRTHTVLYLLNSNDDEKLSTFTTENGGVELSIDYDGHLLAIGKSSGSAEESFNKVSVYHRSASDPLGYDLVENIQLGDAPGTSLSLLTTKSPLENNTKIAVGAPLDGHKQQGSVRLYQVQQFSIK